MINHILVHLLEKVKYRGKCQFFFSSRIDRESKFEGANKVYPRTHFHGTMGYGSYVGPDCSILAHIGRFTSIAPFVHINEGVHPFLSPFVTTSPMFFSTRKQAGVTFADRMIFKESLPYPKIGNDCWICENVFISGGIVINDGAVVLAGAVVTQDVPPYAIVGGVPAKVIRFRYDDDTIRLLLEFKWWEKDIEWIKENWELLSDLNEFKKYVSENHFKTFKNYS